MNRRQFLVSSSAGLAAASFADLPAWFGHAKAGMPVTGSAKELDYFKDYLSRVADMVQKAIKAKTPKEELVKATEVPGFPDHVGSGQGLTLPGILGSVYDEIAA